MDESLIARYRKDRDLKVLGELYDAYMPLVYGVCLKYLKDREESRDAVMQVFEKLIEALLKHEIKHFKSWLYTLTRNHCLMQIRARKGRHFEDISDRFMETGFALHPENDNDEELNFDKLDKCLEELGTEQKRCVHLFYIKQKCYREISDETGYDGNQVKSYIQNGKRNLKICMERNE